LVELVALRLSCCARTLVVRLCLGLDVISEHRLLRWSLRSLLAALIRVPDAVAAFEMGLKVGVGASVCEGFTTEDRLVVLVLADRNLAEI